MGTQPARTIIWYFPFLLCCGFLIGLIQSQGISIIGPNVIQPNRDFTVVIHNGYRMDANLKLTLTCESPSVLEIARLNDIESAVRKLSTKKVTFQVGNIPNDNYKLLIKNFGGMVMFDEEVTLRYVSKTMSIFIQTDKLVYKPGDLIRFRIIVVNIETKPILQLESLIVDLKDENDNTMQQWERTSLYKGVFEENYLLGPASPLGNWSLHVTANDGLIEHNKVKPIEVKQYVLPKFLITVSPSKVLLVSDRQISLTIQSMYTFGDPVNGQARVDLYLTADHRRPDHISKFTLKGGSGRVLFHLAEEIEIDNQMNHGNVMVNVSVTEGFSDQTVFIFFYIPVYRYQYDITMKPSSPQFIPGQKYSIDFTVKDHSGNVPDRYHKLKLTVTYGSSEEDTYVESMLNANGVAKIELYPPVTASSIGIKADFDSIENYEFDSIDAGNHQLKVSINNKPGINKMSELFVRSTTKLESFTCVVFTKGNIILSYHVMLQNNPRGRCRLKFTPEMAPKSTVVVFSETKDSTSNKKLTSYYCLELELPLPNNFKFFADKEQYQPGEDIEITTDAAGDSYVAFNAIDLSSLLLGYDTLGFTKQDVLNELDGYVKDAELQSELNFHGIFLVSSNEVYGSTSRLRRSLSLLSKAASSPVLLRTDFHEVFLWHNFSMHGRKSDHKTLRTVPDTITSWQVTAFALSPTVGLGMMDQPVQFVVKKPFYIVANLPYSIKRNEISLIQVTVFSFLGSEILTEVGLYCKKDEFEFIGQSYTNDTKRRSKVILVPANYGKHTSFMIKAKKLGSIAIKIEARNHLASDGIEHILLVTPESHAYETTESRFIENNIHTKNSHDIPINIPRNIDQGSVNITFAIDPVILGLPKENINSLLRLPTGCGEQNMVKLMPNVVALDYLKESREINKELETKAIDYLNSGYQNQLKYKRKDGSFSVFTSDYSLGSTFLTAFVAQTFKIADKYISVDRSIVNSAFDWLASIQKNNGLFEEVGDIYNTAMQGGLNSRNLALSAFVAIAFLENEEIAGNYSTVVKKTIDHLAEKITKMDTYEMALTTYAFSLYDHPQKRNLLDRLLDRSQLNEERAIYWNEGSLNVEIASYALLSLTRQDKHVPGIAIMRWLVTQRESSGGFWGSQSTFVGLKALAVMASFVNPRKNDYRVTVHSKIVDQSAERSILTDAKITFDITSNTQQVLYTSLASEGRSYKVDIDGRGYGIFQITYQYNQNILNAKNAFIVNATIQDSTTDNKQVLRVCTRFKQIEAYTQSNMALVEVFFPSGFVADQDSVLDLWSGERTGKITLVERRFGDTSVVVYYHNIDVREKCFEVTAYRRFKIAGQHPAYVAVYDYNDKARFGITKYEGKALRPCDICEFQDCIALRC